MRVGPPVVTAIAMIGAVEAHAQPAPDEPGGAGAEPKLIAPGTKPATPKAAPISYSHHKQAMISVRFGTGYRAIVPYDGEYCGETSNDTSNDFAPTCTGRAPFSIDFELGYGVAKSIDLFVELRVGIEPDFDGRPQGDDGPRAFHVSPGARFFFGESDQTKVFTTAQLVLDIAGYKDPSNAEIGNDFGVRNLSGIWFDLDRAYGLYLYAGPTASFARWFRFELEGGIGIQGRYP